MASNRVVDEEPCERQAYRQTGSEQVMNRKAASRRAVGREMNGQAENVDGVILNRAINGAGTQRGNPGGRATHRQVSKWAGGRADEQMDSLGRASCNGRLGEQAAQNG